jgi:hypothetical protein
MVVGDLQWVMARDADPGSVSLGSLSWSSPDSPGAGRDGEGRHLPTLQLQAVPKAAADLLAL